MLRLEGLSKTYRIGTFGGESLQAVSDVSFEVGKGEIVSLIGESGSGKSTIGKMILRLIGATSGKIWFNGTDISTLRGRALKEYYRRVQGVFQDPFCSYNPIFKADRVFRIIREAFFPNIKNDEWADKVHESLECVGLNPAHVLHKYPHQLSGGQLQRFLIARALLLDIDFLVADEIISMLDASTRIDVLNLLGDLKESGLSILFITHDLSLAYYVSERAVILHQGRVVELGSIERIFENPVHPYTRSLMTCVPRLDKKWCEVEAQLQAQQADEGSYPAAPRSKLGRNGHGPALFEVEADHFVAMGQ